MLNYDCVFLNTHFEFLLCLGGVNSNSWTSKKKEQIFFFFLIMIKVKLC